jgi:hypothetical protein
VAIPEEERTLIQQLTNLHDRELPQLKSLNSEYELRSPRSYMHPEILAELGDRIQQVVIAWPQLVVDSLEERLDVEGFRLPKGTADDDLWRIWQENDCDEQSQLATVDALTMRRAYIAVGTNEADPGTPLVTFESPLEVYADIDPRTRKVRSAIRRYGNDGNAAREPERYLTLYEPDRTSYYDVTREWKLIDRDEHELHLPPIIPMINRSRLADWRGRSELDPVLPLSHAANKLATDMMVAAEFVAIPLRGIFGVGPEDLEGEDGTPLTPMQAIMGRLLTIPDDEKVARHFEFASAQLSNFHDSIGQMAKLVASICGLPPDYLGLTTENPPSAESRLAGEIRLIKRAERKQRAFGGAYEQTQRLVRRMVDGDWDPKWRRLETIWRDASTPTVAQTADAAVKKYTAGITTLRQTREDLQYTAAQIERMEADDEAAAERDPLGALTRVAGQQQPATSAAPGE